MDWKVIDITPEEAVIMNWQPIETAPEGEKIIMYYPAQKKRSFSLGEKIAVDVHPVSWPRKPTYWMPLPPSPEVEE